MRVKSAVIYSVNLRRFPLRELKPAYLKTSAPCLRNGKKLLPFYRASEGYRMVIGIHFSDKAVTVFLLMG